MPVFPVAPTTNMFIINVFRNSVCGPDYKHTNALHPFLWLLSFLTRTLRISLDIVINYEKNIIDIESKRVTNK